MKSLWITLLLFATCATSGNSLSYAQTPEQQNKASDERIEQKGELEAHQRLDRIKTSLSTRHSPNNAVWGKENVATDHLIKGETLIITGGADTFWQTILQFLKTAGKSLITGGILSIFSVFILLMLIIHLYVSYTKISEWKLIL